MDEFDEDEDEQIDIDGVPFAAEKDFLEKYGTAFTLSYGENKEVVLTANQAESPGDVPGEYGKASCPGNAIAKGCRKRRLPRPTTPS